MSQDSSYSEDESEPQIPPRHELDENGPEVGIDEVGEKFLATVRSEFVQQVIDFQNQDTEANAFVLNVLDGAQDKDEPDSRGKTLDDYITGAAEALSQLVVEMMRPGEADPKEEIHSFVMLLLKKSDDERTALFNGMVDQTKMSFGYEDEEVLSGKVAEFVAMADEGGAETQYAVASRIAETYFAMAASKLAAVWEYIEASENQDEWTRLLEAVDEIKNTTKQETLQKRLGRHALEVVKVFVGTALGVFVGLTADRYLHRKK